MHSRVGDRFRAHTISTANCSSELGQLSACPSVETPFRPGGLCEQGHSQGRAIRRSARGSAAASGLVFAHLHRHRVGGSEYSRSTCALAALWLRRLTHTSTSRCSCRDTAHTMVQRGWLRGEGGQIYPPWDSEAYGPAPAGYPQPRQLQQKGQTATPLLRAQLKQ